MTQPFSASVSPARQIAFTVLQNVAAGQFASDSLRARSHGLSSRDAGLAAQIVFGSLRFQAQLDYLIFRYSRRRVEMLDQEVTIALRMALFQLRYLQRIPAHAAVHETVELVKAVKRKAAGLANAVLRKVRREAIPWPDRATELSCPEWLLQRWTAHFGSQQALSIARAALLEPAPYIRVPEGAQPPAGVALAATSVPGCFRVLASETLETPEQPPAQPPAARPDLRLHDIGSQSVLPRLDLQPGHTFLDLCAAPGNKTRQALETPLHLAVACDLSPRRLQTVPPLCHRVVLDGTLPLPFGRLFDRIFIDAPCSGTGTTGRNPEIKWRVQEPDFHKFAARQILLIQSALPLLAPGGKLLYATCSLEREENEDVVDRILALHPDCRLESAGWRLPAPPDISAAGAGGKESGNEAGDGFYGALLSRR